MILRRVTEHIKAQNWFAVGLDFLIVVVGVYTAVWVEGYQDRHAQEARKKQIIEALVTDLKNANFVQETLLFNEIDAGLANWQTAFKSGEFPPPFYLRMNGSDTAPDTWNTILQMQLGDLFDPITLFDLGYYYSELDGVGQKYIRYVTFVENEVLPKLKEDPQIFYRDDQSGLKSEYEANMDRLRDFREESIRLSRWGACLVYRLEAKRTFKQDCLRAGFSLEGQAKSTSGDTTP